MTKKIERELTKKQTRRQEELIALQSYNLELHQPVAPKKPMEFKFDKDKADSFAFPVGIGNTVLERKSDGYCVHISIDQDGEDSVKFYSSGGREWNPDCFPEIMDELWCLRSGYYHGEILGVKPEGVERFTSLDEFTAIENRPKLNASKVTDELLEKYPLQLHMFDLLRLEDHSLLAHPFRERRGGLEFAVGAGDYVNPVPQWTANTEEEMQKLFLQAIDNNYEGLIAKDPTSLYVPGSRNSDWMKLKHFTTFDLAVLGVYETEESKKAGKPFSAVLVGSYNAATNKYETMAKIKIGKKQDQEAIMKQVHGLADTMGLYEGAIAANNSIAFNSRMAKIKRKIPNKVINNGYMPIVEVKLLDVTYTENWHSCGYDNGKAHSLRIPTFVQLRTDKQKVSDITTTKQIKEFYRG